MTGNPIRTAITFMVLIGLGFAVYACSQATNKRAGQSQLEKLAVGEMEGLDFAFAGEAAPPDAFDGETGRDMNLQAFAGKYILVNLWATWCGPCEEEMPSLAALQTARGGDKFQVVALSVDDTADAEYAMRRLDELSGGVLDFHLSYDLNITYSLGAGGFPTSILYGPDGIEVARLAGDADWASYEAIAFIDAVIGE